MHIHFSLVRIYLQSDCVPWLLVFFFCAGNNLFFFLPVFFPMVELLFLCFFLLNTYGFLLWDKYYQPAQVPDSTRVNPYRLPLVLLSQSFHYMLPRIKYLTWQTHCPCLHQVLTQIPYPSLVSPFLSVLHEAGTYLQCDADMYLLAYHTFAFVAHKQYGLSIKDVDNSLLMGKMLHLHTHPTCGLHDLYFDLHIPDVYASSFVSHFCFYGGSLKIQQMPFLSFFGISLAFSLFFFFFYRV